MQTETLRKASIHWHEAWGTDELEKSHQLHLAPEFTAAAFGETGLSRDAYIAREARFLGAFTDLAVTVEEEMADGDKVMCRLVISGVHTGDLDDLPASGKPFEIDAFCRDRFANGQVVDHILLLDIAGLKAQLAAASRKEKAAA